MLLILVLSTFFITSGNCELNTTAGANERIVGGQDAVRGEFPYQATVNYGGRLSCGGSLINESWVLTAAHCCGHYPTISSITVVLGNHALNKSDSGEQTIAVDKVFWHPEWDSDTLENDICLLRLSKNATLGQYIKTIKLPTEKEEYAPLTNCTCTGWGTTSEGGSISNILQKVNLSVVKHTVCEDQYGPGNIVDTMFCAAAKGKDSCQGDSGGPLVCEPGKLSGIVSWGYGCAQDGFSGVYTKTSYYIKWINQIMEQNSSSNMSNMNKQSALVLIIVSMMCFLIK